MTKPQYITICTRCGSADIRLLSNHRGGMSGFYCRDCTLNYPSEGIIFPEIEESQIQAFRDELKKN